LFDYVKLLLKITEKKRKKFTLAAKKQVDEPKSFRVIGIGFIIKD